MHVVITGGAGLLGKRLATTLLKQETLTVAGKSAHLSKLVLFDQVAPHPPLPSDPRLEVVTGDLTQTGVAQTLITADTQLIFHLAAIVSGQAEQDFDLGMQVNLAATQALLETCRQLESVPQLIFTSSVAVFGGTLPATIEDNTAVTPQSSYGSQKAIGELLVNDFSRRGFIDGRSLRLPTVAVRPGKPNQATSTFASSIIREPLLGQSAICPVAPETNLWILSPKQAIDSLIHAAELPAERLGDNRIITLPGLSTSVQHIVESLEKLTNRSVVDRIVWQPDPFIQRIVGSWPSQFNPQRATELGFKADASMKTIIEQFIEEEVESIA